MSDGFWVFTALQNKSCTGFNNFIQLFFAHFVVTPSSSSNQQSSTSSSLSHSSATSAFSSSSSRSDDSLNPQAYMDRLKVLRARCGLDNGQTLSASSERPASTSNSQQSISPTSHPSTATSGDLSGLPTQMSSTTVAVSN